MWSKLFLVACLVVAANAGAASFIQKCRPEDGKCLKMSSQAALPVLAEGIPELGIEKLDPLHYDKLDASSKRLMLILNDIQIGGLKQCQIKRVKRDVSSSKTKSKLLFKVLCTVTLDGQYYMNGSLLILPIQGRGKMTGLLRKVVINVDADMFEEVLKDGKKHWEIKTWTYNFELKDKADLDLQNLFEGNELLGNAARQLLKSSANEVINEVGYPIIKALLAKIVESVNKFFKVVPVEELALE